MDFSLKIELPRITPSLGNLAVSFSRSSFFISIYQKLKKQFHQDIQRQIYPQKLGYAPIFNSLLGVGCPQETRPLVFSYNVKQVPELTKVGGQFFTIIFRVKTKKS